MKKHSSIFLKITTLAVWLTCIMGGAFAQTPSDEGTHNVTEASSCDTYTWDANGVTYHASGVYTYAYTNTDGFASVDTLKLTIHPLPNVVAHTHDPRICKGNSVVLTAEADIPCAFSWGSAGLGQPIEVSPKKTTTYRVTAVDTIYGCQAKASIKVEVEAVKITASPSLQVCEGENVTLTASGAIEYYWFLEEPQTTASVTVNESGTYVVQGIHNGCNTHDTVVVTVYPKPDFTINGYNEICPEESSITLAASGTQDYQYEWGDGQTTASIDVMMAGVYSVTGRNEHGCTNTISKTVAAGSHPTITISGQDTICEGSSITLQATNANSCVWKNALDETIGTGPQIEVSPTLTTDYWVYGEVDDHRCYGIGQKIIRVISTPEVSIMGDSLVCEGSSQTLIASARYPGLVSFVWPGLGTGTSISVTQNEPQTTYTLVGIAENGCRGTATKTIRTRKGVGKREHVTVCGESYTWRGRFLVESNVYVSPFATQDENGCECYDTLDLTVNHTPNQVETISESEYYTWPKTGDTYYFSGTYTTEEHLNEHGCPAADTLHLTILNDEIFNNECMIYAFTVKRESCDPGHDGVLKLSVQEEALEDCDIDWTLGNGESSSALVVSNLAAGVYHIKVTSKTCPDVTYYQDDITLEKEEGCELTAQIIGPNDIDGVCGIFPTVTYTIHPLGGKPPYYYPEGSSTFQYKPAADGHFRLNRSVIDANGSIATCSFDGYAKTIVCPQDPNEITGPEGYDEEKHYVNATDKMNYRIDFENDPDFATAPASRVKVTYDVPAEQNMASFRLGEFGFGSFIYTVPSNVTSYYQRLDVSDSLGVWVDVTAGIDVMNHQLFWIFQSIDPATGAEPVNATMGFLAINDSLGHGEGYVTFNIQPKNTVSTGDTVAVDAMIVFDENAPIGTNVWVNTFDAVAPTSTLVAEMNELDSLYCTFTFAAQDDADGSGVKEVEVFMSKNNGTYQSLGATHPDSSLVYALESGMYYRFMSIATDNVGNKEPLKAQPDTTVNYNTAPIELMLSSNTFYEYDPRYTLIGTLSTVDDDMSQPFVYTLVNGEGDDDNDLFTIEGNSLKTDTTFVCSQNYDYYVRIRTTDFGGMYYEKSFKLKEIRQHITPTVNIPKTLCEGESLTFFDTLLTTAGNYTKILQTPEGCDSIVVWFVTMSPSYHNAPIDTTVCNAFEWNDSIYTESDVISHTYTLPTGCDSTVTYNLTVNHSTHNVMDTVICNSYVWHDLTCDTTGVYTYEYTNSEGCSSIDTLYLTVNHSTHNVMDTVVCNSYVWHDLTCDTTGVYTYEYTNSEGCSSIDTLYLTVNHSTHNVKDTVVCNSYVWHNLTCDTTGVYTYEYTNSEGCSSIDTLYLTVNHSTHNVMDTVVCNSYVWHDLTCDTTGVYTYEYTNSEGCSSIDTLYLTVNQPTFGDTTVVAVGSFTWFDTTYSVTPNIAPTHTFTNAAGCDSLVTLYLTITNPDPTIHTVTVTSASATAPIVYDGTTHGDEYKSYTVTYDGNPVSADDASGLLFTLPSGDMLTVTPTFAGVTNVYDINNTAHNNVFTYNITNPDLYASTTTATYGTVNLVPRPITISSDTTKAYDGTPFEISYNQLNVSNLVTGESLTGGTVTSESYHVGEYSCTDGAFNYTMALAATQSGFEVSSGKANYAPTFNTKLTITGRNLTITAGNAQKTYDGSDLTTNSFTTNGLASTDIVNATVSGLQRCVGESASSITSYTVTNGGKDVTGDYTITTVPGTLKVTPVTTGFNCPASVTFTLANGDTEITLTEADLNGPATLSPAVAGAYAGNNLAALNPFEAGTHNVTWTLYDECGHAMTNCNQLVTVENADDDCNDTMTYMGHTYAYKRIGSQCWFTENLRAEIGTDYHAYNDDSVNLAKFGYLYSWYTAVGVTEGDNNAVPETHTAPDGSTYIQGICPPGWAVPSMADIAKLNLIPGGTAVLKDPSTDYWLSGFEGIPGGTGFNARAGGRYNAVLDRYEDLMTSYHFWASDATPGSIKLFSACAAYYCGYIILTDPNQKNDRKSVRCLRKNPN